MTNAAEQLDTPVGNVPATDIMHVWDRVEPMLRRVVTRETGHTMQSVLTQLQMAKMQLWIVGDFQAAVITMVEDRPVEKVLWVQYMAGDKMAEWLDDWIAAQEWFAKANGCTAIEFSGRRGWRKVEQRYPDYKSTRTIFRREL